MMSQKNGVYDEKELWAKRNGIIIEALVQAYYDKLEYLFIRGKILDVKEKKMFLPLG